MYKSCFKNQRKWKKRKEIFIKSSLKTEIRISQLIKKKRKSNIALS